MILRLTDDQASLIFGLLADKLIENKISRAGAVAGLMGLDDETVASALANETYKVSRSLTSEFPHDADGRPA